MNNSSSAYQKTSIQDVSTSKIRFSAITAEQLSRIGAGATRYALALLLFIFGVFKFYTFEAQAIQPLVANSPFMSWMYSVLSLGQVSALIGATEIAIALLIAIKPWKPKLSAYGSLGAVLIFTTSLSFMISTPGMWVTEQGLPVPSDGGFIFEDILLLGSAIWTAADALIAYNRQRSQR